MLLKKFSQYIKEQRQAGKNIRVNRANGNQDFDFAKYQPQETEYVEAQIVEDNGAFCTKKIKVSASGSKFNYFLDGIEKKRILMYYNFIPFTYGYMSAVIMKRTDKKMHSIGLKRAEENIYLPFKFNGDEPEFYLEAEDFKDYNINPINIGIKAKGESDYPLMPEEFEKKAHSAIQENRRHMESTMANEWALEFKNSDDWLYVDGGLTNISSELMKKANVVGVIKSHNVQYFDYEKLCRIYNIKKGERSCAFRPKRRFKNTPEKVFSWYLRLHSDKNYGKMDFGIIRVEIPDRADLLSKVDEISSWILLEANPIAFPESRWDRMIYPIKYCEDYLKCKAPSWTLLESLAFA